MAIARASFGSDTAPEPGTQGTPASDARPTAVILSPIAVDRLGCRADEDQAGVAAGTGERRSFGQESVAGMDRVATGPLRRPDQQVRAEVAVGRLRRTEDDDLVGHPRGQAVDVRVGNPDHGLDAEVTAGPDDADRDLAAIGDEHSPDVVPNDWDVVGHAAASASVGSTIIRICSCSTA